MSTERVIVDQSIASEFEAALQDAMKGLQDKQFELIRPGQTEELKQLVDEALAAVSDLSSSRPVFAISGSLLPGSQDHRQRNTSDSRRNNSRNLNRNPALDPHRRPYHNKSLPPRILLPNVYPRKRTRHSPCSRTGQFSPDRVVRISLHFRCSPRLASGSESTSRISAYQRHDCPR